MVKKAVICSLVFLLLLTTAFALEAYKTPITIRADFGNEIEVTVTAEKAATQTYSKEINSTGETTIYYHSLVTQFSVLVDVFNDGVLLMSKDFGTYNAGSPITLSAIISAEEPEENVTSNETATSNETEEESEEAETNRSISGFFINLKDKAASYTKVFFYILGIVVILGIVIFAVMKFIHSREEGSSFNLKDGILVRKESVDAGLDKKEFVSTKKKLEEAEKEIAKLKSQSKIKEAEERVKKAKEELDRVKKGESVEED